MRKLVMLPLLIALVACNRDGNATRTSGANENVVPTDSASSTDVADATSTTVLIPTGTAPTSATAAADTSATNMSATSTAGTAEPPKDTAPAPASQIAAGQAVYRSNCAGCHGADGRQEIHGVTLASKATQSKPDAELARILREGTGKTSAVAHKNAGLDAKQIEIVIAYVKALQ